MRRIISIAVAALSLSAAGARAEHRAHTYSIVARDPATGNFGVAVQSHWFQVGPIVPWAEAGVGAVATQSFVRVDYGPLGLALMRAGKSPEEALQSLLATDPQKDVRQVAMVDKGGAVAAWTGPKCIQAAGHADRRRLLGAGQPDGQGDGVAGDGARLRGGEGRLRRAPARRARGGRGRGRRHPRPAERRDPHRARRSRPGGRGRTGWSTCASRTIRSRSPSCAACSTCTAPTTP